MSNDIFEHFKLSDLSVSSTESSEIRHESDIFDLANCFLAIEAMTHKKLQKLCYYAKAWYLAINDENLIKEPFEAWVHGAVQPTLYQEYRAYGFQIIPMFVGDVSRLPEGFLSFSKEIFDSYGKFSGDELEKINHQEMPWIKARGDLKPWQNGNTVISEDDMKEYYRSLMDNEK